MVRNSWLLLLTILFSQSQCCVCSPFHSEGTSTC